MEHQSTVAVPTEQCFQMKENNIFNGLTLMPSMVSL